MASRGLRGRERAASSSALVLPFALAVAAGLAGWMPEARADDLIGETRTRVAVAEDTLIDIAVEEGVGILELMEANPGVDPWLPEPGRTIVLPTRRILPPGPRTGIVINLAEYRLYWYPPKGGAESFPVGIGTEEAGIARGSGRIVRKRPNPVWTPPPGVRAEAPDLPPSVPPGPDNPLGAFALDTSWPLVVIHGTNKPYGVGRRVSHGCFRLYPPHIAALFAAVAIGTPVSVIDVPVKFGWAGGDLWVEVHDTADADLSPRPALGEIVGAALDAAGPEWPRLSWPLLLAAVQRADGLPARVTEPAGAEGQ